MVHERRHFVRVGFDAPAQITIGADTFLAQVLDVSLKGALLRLPPQALAQARPGLPCQLSVPLLPTQEQLSMATDIAHLDGDLAGLQCRTIDLDSVTHLRRIIELQLGDAALLERDLAELITGQTARTAA